MIKNIKVEDKIVKQLGVVGLSLVMSISGFMLGRQYELNKAEKNTLDYSTNEISSDFELKNYIIYDKYLLNNETNEVEFMGTFTSENPLIDTNNSIYIYKGNSSVYVNTNNYNYDNEVLVYDKYNISSNGEKQYDGEIHCAIPPRNDSSTFYKFKYLYKKNDVEKSKSK